MLKPIQRTGQNNPFTWESPEDGKWWHYVSPSGLEVLKNTPNDFGKDEKSEYPRPPALDGKRIVRMANSRKGALNYEMSEKGGALLVLDPSDLRDNKWCPNLRNGNRIVLPVSDTWSKLHAAIQRKESSVMTDEPKKEKGVVDLVILLDVSGSMQECIDALKGNIRDFVAQMSSKDANNESPIKDWRIKVCGYRDQQADGANWFVDNSFVRDVAGVQSQLSAPNMQHGGGGDEPESLLDALWKLAKMEQSGIQDEESPDKWRARGAATRIIVFFTDATYKTPMTLPEAAGGGVADVISALMAAKIIPVGFVPEWTGYLDLAACDPSEMTAYVKVESCPAIAKLGSSREEGGEAAQAAAVQALKALSRDSEGFAKLMRQLAKTVVKSGNAPMAC